MQDAESIEGPIEGPLELPVPSICLQFDFKI